MKIKLIKNLANSQTWTTQFISGFAVIFKIVWGYDTGLRG